jgi:hypothetical protein
VGGKVLELLQVPPSENALPPAHLSYCRQLTHHKTLSGSPNSLQALEEAIGGANMHATLDSLPFGPHVSQISNSPTTSLSSPLSFFLSHMPLYWRHQCGHYTNICHPCAASVPKTSLPAMLPDRFLGGPVEML